MEVGHIIIGTTAAHRVTVQDVVLELGLGAQVIGNRNAVMILPAGINKATGLEYALRKLGLSRREVVSIRDDATQQVERRNDLTPHQTR